MDRDANSRLGTELDGALANEFFVSIRRSEYDARGHSRKEPWATAKKATYGDDERPAHLHLHRKHDLKIWDAIDRQIARGSVDIKLHVTISLNLPIRFTAKVALAAGYFVYGDLFRDHVDHDQLRDVMRIDPVGAPQREGADEHGVHHITARADHYLCEPPTERDWRLRCLRSFCTGVRGSVIVIFLDNDHFGVAVGILGQYLAMISVPANTKTFPNEGAYAWGHVLAVGDKKLRRCSWAEGLRQWTSTSDKK